MGINFSGPDDIYDLMDEAEICAQSGDSSRFNLFVYRAKKNGEKYIEYPSLEEAGYPPEKIEGLRMTALTNAIPRRIDNFLRKIPFYSESIDLKDDYHQLEIEFINETLDFIADAAQKIKKPVISLTTSEKLSKVKTLAQQFGIDANAKLAIPIPSQKFDPKGETIQPV